MLDTLDRYHGQATGIFTCDEHLAGRSPSQGTELCTVAEAMYSLELLEGITGDARVGDRLEKLAFNAFPATFKKDMTAHQYDQQANQVVCKVSEPKVYTSNKPDANVYGLEPNFGCCTANMHQGWPKFATHLWTKSPDGGLVAMVLAPCVVETTIDGKPIKVEVVTDYPFSDRATIELTIPEGMTMLLRIRVPSWAKGATFFEDEPVAATPGTFFEARQKWAAGRHKIPVRLPMPVTLYSGYNDSVAIERGPLVYALKIGTEWKKLKGEEPFADYEVFPTTPWNYALQIDREHPEESITFETRPVGDRPLLTSRGADRGEGEGAQAPRLDTGEERRRTAPEEPCDERGTAGGPDADPVWMHRPPSDGVPVAHAVIAREAHATSLIRRHFARMTRKTGKGRPVALTGQYRDINPLIVHFRGDTPSSAPTAPTKGTASSCRSSRRRRIPAPPAFGPWPARGSRGSSRGRLPSRSSNSQATGDRNLRPISMRNGCG